MNNMNLVLKTVTIVCLLDVASNQKRMTFTPVPWIGLLVYRPGGDERNLVTGVILIHDNLAIADAGGIAKLDSLKWENVRNKTDVVFLTEDHEEWYAKVAYCNIHPEFNIKTLTSIAILHLEYNSEHYRGYKLFWPNRINYTPFISDNTFTIGFTDRDFKLEQMVYRMDLINTETCSEFYVNEKLNSKWLRPANYHCYSVLYAKESCIFEAGMALVHHYNKSWTLLGISTWGPGCALPGRFIDFEPYVSWIAKHIPTRRAKQLHDVWWAPDPAPKIQDLDSWILSRTADNSYTLKPINKKEGYVEKLMSNCSFIIRKASHLVYRDRTFFTPEFGHQGVMTGVYGVSLYDLRYGTKNYTCIQITAYSDYISDFKMWYTKSMEQGYDLEHFIQRQPIGPSILKPAETTYHLDESWLKYTSEIIGSEITNLIFKFRFKNTAYFDIEFYAKSAAEFTTRTSAVSTTKRPKNATRRTKTTRPPTPEPQPPKVYWWHEWWKYNPDERFNWWIEKNATTSSEYNTTSSENNSTSSENSTDTGTTD